MKVLSQVLQLFFQINVEHLEHPLIAASDVVIALHLHGFY